MEPLITIGKLVGLPAAAGLNAYATILTFGLLLRFNLITDPAYLSPKFQMFASDGMIFIAAVCYVLEFLADKVPGIDHLWDAVHSLIRPLVGALLAFYSIGALDPDASYALIALATVLGGGVAAATHTTKATVRLLSTKTTLGTANWFLSLFEDGVAIVASYLAVTNPSVAGALVIVFLVLFVTLFPKILKVSHSWMLKLSYFLRWLFQGLSGKISPEEISWIEPIPTRDYRKLRDYLLREETIHVLLRNIHGTLGIGGPGWFVATDRRLVLMGKKWFRWQFQDIPYEKITNLGARQGTLSDSMVIYTSHASQKVSLLKDPHRSLKTLVDKLQTFIKQEIETRR